MHRTRRVTQDDQGFSMLELAVTMVLAGILLALAVGPFTSFRRGQEERGATREIVGLLREVQSKSVSEECVYRVTFAPASTNSVAARMATVQKRETSGNCDASGSWVTKETRSFAGTAVWVKTASFDNLAADADVTPSSAYFYARGTGSPGSLTLVRTGSAKTYTVSIEGLTGRVSSDLND